jgi:hypothetical protein
MEREMVEAEAVVRYAARIESHDLSSSALVSSNGTLMYVMGVGVFSSPDQAITGGLHRYFTHVYPTRPDPTMRFRFVKRTGTWRDTWAEDSFADVLVLEECVTDDHVRRTTSGRIDLWLKEKIVREVMSSSRLNWLLADEWAHAAQEFADPRWWTEDEYDRKYPDPWEVPETEKGTTRDEWLGKYGA